jgi:uncharacterized GH25 family protein
MNSMRWITVVLLLTCASAFGYALAGAEQEGASITGRVEWPDGKPAAGAQVRWSVVDGDAILSSNLFGPSVVETDARGEFEIPKLKAAAFRVEARVKKTGDPNPWVAVTDSVQPGAPLVVLKLSPGEKLEGRVVDDRGKPIRECRVRALRIQRTRDGSGMSSTAIDPVDVRDAQGRFVLLGLTPGTWEVHAEAANGNESQPLSVTVPSKAPIELRVLRTGSIAGRVVDPRGQAVAGAKVRYPQRRPGIAFSMSDSSRVVETDKSGAFRIADLEPAVLLLTASASGFAPSEQLTVALKSGEQARDVVLTLRVGGIIAGQVVDAADKPVPNREVRASDVDSVDFLDDHRAVTDADGRFEIRDLAAGTYEVTLPKADTSGGFGNDDSQAVEVVAGETARVVLGKPKVLPYRVHGVIRVGSEPLAGAALSATKIYDNPTFAQAETKTDAEGRYELGFDRPGTHWWDFSIGELSFLARRVVSKEAQQTINFTVKGGRLGGRLLGVDGKPAAGATVAIVTGRASVDVSEYFVEGSAQTDADGRFVFAPLTPAKYRIQIGRAGGAQFDRGQSHGLVIREDLDVSETAPLEVELALEPACTVTGVLRGPDGKPAADAFVLGRDARGVLFDRERLTRTDAEGRFSIHGLPPGKATFFACTPELASVESEPVLVDAAKPVSIELKLRKATRLWVDLQTADGGNVTQSQVRVFDALDRDVKVRWWDEEPDDEVEGSFVGTLTPGKYRITATHHTGASASMTVELNGEPVKAVELRYPR